MVVYFHCRINTLVCVVNDLIPEWECQFDDMKVKHFKIEEKNEHKRLPAKEKEDNEYRPELPSRYPNALDCLSISQKERLIERDKKKKDIQQPR